jgi:lysine-N-methylase
VDGVLEGSLSLSCPEATRNVLLDEGFLARTGRMESNRFRTDNFLRLARGPGKRGEDFHAVRAAVIGLIGDRARPMGLRVLRVGALCALLQAGARAEDVVRAAQRSDWDDELRALPGNLKVRLDVTRQLSAERAGDKTSGQRFQQTYSKFMRGLGPQGRLERFADAESTLYSKLLEERPYLMENFLVNYIYQKLFPFGRADGLHLRESSVFEEFLLMATLFAWMETLLIGVAAAEGNDFGAADVVKVVQSFCRAVEHYPYVLENVLLTMRTRGLDSLAGMALILRAAE